ncbi:DUF6221 family protein [Streptomyces nitrosporeus]|uniref:Uncharacterized protein n=1 Tax=Streptomyces nitrosporeus TaxID=28894 RepID=A0A5J6FLU0_9ACTN|nr:DUF6221 family protein [Streptomyces nitrosporeus]QEU76891.1 hypothetical protein CP967_32140 [Streptomyces nitrosporeus]
MADNADLLAFVRARLAEEEHIAQEAGADSWRCPAGVPGEVHDRAGGIAFVVRSRGYDRHIAFQDPARTLRRIETNRVLLDEYEEIASLDTDRPRQDFSSGRAVGLGFVVRQMAAEHAGHPDYRVKWLPRFSHWGPPPGRPEE